jgi:TPR repeat
MNIELQCKECALKNTPENVRVIEIRESLDGRAWLLIGKLSAPRPVTPRALFIFLHECAHFVLHSDGKRRKRYLEEMQAEKWALARMQESGIPVPRDITRESKERVRLLIHKTSGHGAGNVDKEALRYAGISPPSKYRDKARIEISMLSSAIRLKSAETAYSCARRARVCFSLSCYAEAIEDLNEAIRLKPNNLDFYTCRAKVYSAVGNYQKAEADRKKAKELAGH